MTCHLLAWPGDLDPGVEKKNIRKMGKSMLKYCDVCVLLPPSIMLLFLPQGCF